LTNDELRRAVASQLINLSAGGQPLHADSRRRTAVLYAGDSSRRFVHMDIVAQYMDREQSRHEGRSAIITAGPPGAGKTSSLQSEVPDLESYRILDADIVKDYLIKQAVADGIYDDLLQQELADGHPIAPGELAALVHDESVQLIERIRRICIGNRDKVVVEATLRWPDHGPTIFAELAAADYTAVRILAIEAEREFVHEQALTRWWTQRADWIDRQHPLGGRFVPPAAIDMCYPASGLPHCTQQAINLMERAEDGEIECVRLTILRRNGTGAPETLVDREVQT
jgi:hypothetical protein